jgi:hypothetical protein
LERGRHARKPAVASPDLAVRKSLRAAARKLPPWPVDCSRLVVCSCLVVCGWVAVANAQTVDAGHVEGPDAGATEPNPFDLPGTQPDELTLELRSPKVCKDCHGGFAADAPNDAWGGTMMANAARDPLFHAALTVANQDSPLAGDLCIRCHAPRAWLFGRSTPAELANLEPDDFESVQCDFCHRLVDQGTADGLASYIGNAQYFVADDFVRRGTISDSVSTHEWQYSRYFSQSELCGPCHDVSNPAEGGFAIERTYTEWRNSAYPSEDITCQQCHMPEIEGPVAGARGMPDRTGHQHQFAGGNVWMPLVLSAEYPELGREEQYAAASSAAQRMLQGAATLSVAEIETTGTALRFLVRVENNTGHKLPTGYPEGRQCWLEVKVSDPEGNVLLHSGAYDVEQGRRLQDAQLRRYEVAMADDGQPGLHFVLQNELLEDTRIPPRGFRATPDTAPLGRQYPALDDGVEPVLAHWDDAPYTVDLPETNLGPLLLEAQLLYQTVSREYVEFLRDENHTDDSGERMFELWEQHGGAPPSVMTRIEVEIGRDLQGLSAGDTAPDSDAGASDRAAPDAGSAAVSMTGDAQDAAVRSGASGARPVLRDAGVMDAPAPADAALDLEGASSRLGDAAPSDSASPDQTTPTRASASLGGGCSCQQGGRRGDRFPSLLAFLAFLISVFALRQPPKQQEMGKC